MKYFLIICALFVTFSINSIEIPDSIALQTLNITSLKFNQYDTNGEKQGLWIEYNDGQWPNILMRYYENGQLSGPWRSYLKRNARYVLWGIGTYLNGKPTGNLYAFDEYGNLEWSISQISILKDFKNAFFSNDVELYQFYIRYFWPNGVLKSEGWCYSSEELIIDAEYVGEWKFYDQDGNLIEVKNL